VTSLLDYQMRTSDRAYLPDIENTFSKNAASRFLNDFYDDDGWWALAWIRAFEVTHDARYLAAASTIFVEMQKAWDDTCGGGIWWNKAHEQKNAIANELFMAIALRLRMHATNAPDARAYLAWATRTWTWLTASGIVDSSSIVRDGLDSSCADDGHPPHTYTQGVLVGALLDLATATGDASLADRARSIADATLTAFVDGHGVLRERCEPSCGADNVRFKGIFMRNLGALADVVDAPRYRAFLAVNADWIWNAARENDAVGLVWSGPYDRSDAGRQSSALDALNAAVPSADAAPNLARGVRATGGACRRGEEPSAAVDGRVRTKWCAPLNGIDYKAVVSVVNNGLPVTIHRFVSTSARFVRLAITDPQCEAGPRAARIDELEVYAR
jgi:predicted alpha-1,6-mannanase (GH76 family)